MNINPCNPVVRKRLNIVRTVNIYVVIRDIIVICDYCDLLLNFIFPNFF